MRICFWFKQTRLSLIKESVKQKIPRLLCASSASREATVNDNSIYQKTHFLLQSFVLVLGSLSGEWSRVQPTKKQIAMYRKQKRNRMWGTCIYVNICIPVTHNTTQHTPFLILKQRSELWKENFVLLKRRVWRQIDALLFHFHSQTSTETISPCPESVKSFPSFSSLCFKRELRRLWMQVPLVIFRASFPSAEATQRLCKRLEHSKIWKWIFFSFFSSFLAGTILFLWIRFWFNERVDPELLYIFLTRLMHSANSF